MADMIEIRAVIPAVYREAVSLLMNLVTADHALAIADAPGGPPTVLLDCAIAQVAPPEQRDQFRYLGTSIMSPVLPVTESMDLSDAASLARFATVCRTTGGLEAIRGLNRDKLIHTWGRHTAREASAQLVASGWIAQGAIAALNTSHSAGAEGVW